MTARWRALLSAKCVASKTPTSINAGRWIRHQTLAPEHRFHKQQQHLPVCKRIWSGNLRKGLFPPNMLRNLMTSLIYRKVPRATPELS